MTECDTTGLCVFTQQDPFVLHPENAGAVEVYSRVVAISPEEHAQIPVTKNGEQGLQYRIRPSVSALYDVVMHLPDDMCASIAEREMLIEKVLFIHNRRLERLE